MLRKTSQKELAVIYRQEILQDIRLFNSQPKARYYDGLFKNLGISVIESAVAKTGRPEVSKSALLGAFIVMKCEGFNQITDLVNYLTNNLLLVLFCGFNIVKPLPSYWTFDRFIRKLDNNILKGIMQSQVSRLSGLASLIHHLSPGINVCSYQHFAQQHQIIQAKQIQQKESP